jgi:hypothetical protein
MAMTALSSRATCRYAARLLLRRRSCANLSPRLWLQTDDVRGHTGRSATGAPRAFAQRQNAAIRRQQAADGTWTALPPEDDGPGTDKGLFRRAQPCSNRMK